MPAESHTASQTETATKRGRQILKQVGRHNNALPVVALSRVVSMLEPGGGWLQLNRFTTDSYVVIVKTEYKLVKKTEDSVSSSQCCNDPET